MEAAQSAPMMVRNLRRFIGCHIEFTFKKWAPLSRGTVCYFLSPPLLSLSAPWPPLPRPGLLGSVLSGSFPCPLSSLGLSRSFVLLGSSVPTPSPTVPCSPVPSSAPGSVLSPPAGVSLSGVSLSATSVVSEGEPPVGPLPLPALAEPPPELAAEPPPELAAEPPEDALLAELAPPADDA
ncbi:hypothetical protein DEV91_102311 [Phyllobacterium brassicacearum]|nr:hypothetical protein DEV91_102311 [Phyllobacterium brassicacearum]